MSPVSVVTFYLKVAANIPAARLQPAEHGFPQRRSLVGSFTVKNDDASGSIRRLRKGKRRKRGRSACENEAPTDYSRSTQSGSFAHCGSFGRSIQERGKVGIRRAVSGLESTPWHPGD